MRRKIQLSIPKPCHEKWSDFTPTQRGGFCSSCQKEVIDFTGWSEERLKAYFKNASSGTCGRFREDQLKPYYYGQKKLGLHKWLPVAITSLLLIASRQGSAQTGEPLVEQSEPEANNEEVAKLQDAEPIIVVRGTVTDENGVVMPGVTVRRSGASEETVSDHLGNFVLTLNNARAWDIITFDFIGMVTFKHHVFTDKPHQYVNIVMKYDVAHLETSVWAGGISIHRPWYSPRRWWWAIKNLF